MWNSKKYAVMAVLGVGLTVAAATPASAWWPGAYGNAGGCGYYGYASAYGHAGGCGYGAYGYAPAYAGVYSYGWPYGTVGYGGWGAYGYAGCCGYGAYGYAPVFGASGYGSAYYGYGCHARHVHGHGGYALAYAPRSSYHGDYVSASNPNLSARRHFASMKQIAHGG
jgi:hypothetical protein